MSVPLKFREIGDFHEYYSGVRTAPYLTIFVGGNHEASNHLWELYYGGWVAPNIYYLGAANVVRFGPLRIAGLSGIWKGYNYNKPRHERLPFNQDDLKSIYHVRELDVRKLLQIRTQVDVGISHDWPRGIEWKGNWQKLFAIKDLFEADARAGTLGSTAAKYVMDRLRPPYWFSAHLHVKFAAVVQHDKDTVLAPQDASITSEYVQLDSVEAAKTDKEFELGGPESGSVLLAATVNSVPVHNADEIDIDMDDDDVNGKPTTNGFATLESINQDEISLNLEGDDRINQAADQPEVSEDLRSQLPASFARPTPALATPDMPPPPDIFNKTTHFLALDKCLPNRKFLQILDVEPMRQPASPITHARPLRLEYDKEWLAITRFFAADLSLGDPSASVPPNKGEAHYRPLIEKEEEWVEEHIVKPGKMTIPENFEPTAPAYDPAMGIRVMEQPWEYTNPQTAQFCSLLGIENKFHASDEEREARRNAGPRPAEQRSGGGGRGGGRGGGGFNRGRGAGRGRGRGRGRGWR
ncbi:MAG: hypothetical protein M1830_010133 [Pleopsidium flavum]|nr:MAG: hypothetical protein M1830_010133 [Pleopsidium flavum]